MSAGWPRFNPSDFKVRTIDGVATGWPITYERLEPYYDLSDRTVGVTGLAGEPAYPLKSPRQAMPLALGTPAETLGRGFDKLGWHWWPSNNAMLGEAYDGRPAYYGKGKVGVGGSSKSRAGKDVTYWPKAIAKGARLETQCRVRELTITPDGLAGKVVYYDSEGNVSEQNSRVVVMACNGVGSPRLLLNSTWGLFPSGVANSSGLLGKKLMFHTIVMVMGSLNGRWTATRFS